MHSRRRLRRVRNLVTAINYWPEISGDAPYTSMFAERLATLGHDITVLTGLAHYPDGHIRAPNRGRLAVAENRTGVTIRLPAHFVPSKQSALRRALYEGSLLVTGSMLPGEAAAGCHRWHLAVRHDAVELCADLGFHPARDPGRGRCRDRLYDTHLVGPQ
jgi:hypothetical protein